MTDKLTMQKILEDALNNKNWKFTDKEIKRFELIVEAEKNSKNPKCTCPNFCYFHTPIK